MKSIYVSSNVNYALFFPVYVQVPEKSFITKSCLINENSPKTTLEMSIWLTEN